MTRPRAGGDAGSDRLDEAGHALGREPVEVRRVGLLELGAVLAVGVAAEPVHDDEQDLRVRGLDQRRDVHAVTVPLPSWLAPWWSWARAQSGTNLGRNQVAHGGER
jgi:hypothetical protein